MLFRSPVFTIAVLLTLAVGIGLNTTIFSIVDGILFRPLPYEEPEELFTLVGTDRTGTSYGMVFEQDFLNLRRFHPGFESLVAAEPAQLGALRLKEGTEASESKRFQPASCSCCVFGHTVGGRFLQGITKLDTRASRYSVMDAGSDDLAATRKSSARRFGSKAPPLRLLEYSPTALYFRIL